MQTIPYQCSNSLQCVSPLHGRSCYSISTTLKVTTWGASTAHCPGSTLITQRPRLTTPKNLAYKVIGSGGIKHFQSAAPVPLTPQIQPSNEKLQCNLTRIENRTDRTTRPPFTAASPKLKPRSSDHVDSNQNDSANCWPAQSRATSSFLPLVLVRRTVTVRRHAFSAPAYA